MRIEGLLYFVVTLLFAVVLPPLLFENPGNTYPYSLALTGFVLLSLLVALIMFYSKKWAPVLFALLIPASLLMISTWLFYGTEVTLGALTGDNIFSISMINRFSKAWASVDFWFKGLSSHYPFYFHYIMGKISGLFSLSPEWSFKQGIFALIYLGPLLAFLLWLKIVEEKGALIFTLASLGAVGISGGAIFYLFQKSYEIFVLYLIIPWWLYYLEGVRNNIKKALWGGALGGFLFGVYYYWFFPLVVYYLIQPAKTLRRLIKEAKYHIVFALSFLAVSGFYLLPYLKDIFTKGFEPHANEHLLPAFNNFPLSFMTLGKAGLVFLLALGYLIYRRKEKIPGKLLLLLLSSYLWVAFCYLGIFLGIPLLVSKAFLFIILLFFLGLGLWTWEMTKTGAYARIGLTLFLIFSLVPLFVRIEGLASSGKIERLYTYSRPEIPGNAKSVQAVEGKVLLATSEVIKALSPFGRAYFFLPFHTLAAHPSSLSFQRIAFLKLLSSAGNPRFIVWAFRHNRFDRIDYLWTGDNGSIEVMVNTFSGVFPSPRVKIRFPSGVFSLLKEVDRNVYRIPHVNFPKKIGLLERIVYNDFGKEKPLPLGEKPIFSGKFSIYLDGRKIILTREPCSPRDIKFPLFLKFHGQGKSLLRKINARAVGVLYRHKCVVPIKLPAFEVRYLTLWQVNRWRRLDWIRIIKMGEGG